MYIEQAKPPHWITLNQVIFLLLSFTLWIDALTGMVQLYGISNIKLSLLYKLPLVLCMLYVVGEHNHKLMLAIMLAMFLLLLGPSSYFLTSPKISFYVKDFGNVVKILTPFIVFCYCKTLAEVAPNLLGKYGLRALWINFGAIVFNLIIGVMGFGYPSYASGGVDDEGIGINGFYTAGNEFGGCFILLFGFVLHYFWNKNKLHFFFMAIATFISGALIATKSAMIASLLLIFAIPLFNERKNIFRFTKLKLKLFVPISVLSLLLVVFIIEFLEAVGLYDKMHFILNERGILHLILSGRVEFSEAILSAFMSVASGFEYLFGIGAVGISDFFATKYSAEVDPVDLFAYYGLIGLTASYAFIIIMTVTALSVLKTDKYLPPIIILVNLILILLSILSGHIMMSGMLGLIWGLLNGLIFIKKVNKPIGL
ncbi:O-antigen ligase family protein [Catenovulum sp. SM1970]|uniref:O-antigen ligase family protein n=1 Tax=Marinifaba aquimaris TaxID=2741323 RepID=UPI0015738E83|nr:O-antigen ligase family protein [Marinifaba aquimaris]NTS76899.1 O-antigen ligase family protein [Marinifaba aquimaris]